MDQTGSGNSTLALGANQTIASLTGNTTSRVAIGANALTVGTTSGSTTYAGAISGNGSLIKDDLSTLILSGGSSFTGKTYITNGALIVSATGNLSSSQTTVTGSTFTVNSGGSAGAIDVNAGGTANINGLALDIIVHSGGTLTGSGYAGSVTVNSGGTLAPGNHSKFTATALDLGTGLGSTVTFGINSGTTYDSIATTTAPKFGGTMDLRIDNQLAYGTTLILFDFGGTPTGHFAAITTANGTWYTTVTWGLAGQLWTSSAMGDGQYLTFNEANGQMVVYPEPQTWVLVGIGITFLLYRRRPGRPRSKKIGGR